MLYLAVEVGIGGVLVVDGQPLTGAQGESGEFGHVPFGSPELRCPCGATGCWDLEVDGRALARVARGGGRRRILVASRARACRRRRRAPPEESAAVAVVAGALGRGTGALVNALDPELVVYGGLAPDIHRVARPTLEAAFHEALMAHRRRRPPSIAASALGEDASLLGAAEQAFDLVLTPGLVTEP